MCRSRFGLFAVVFACVATTALAGQKDVARPGEIRADDDSGEPLTVVAADPARAEIAAAGAAGSCRTVGAWEQIFNGPSRFRGNAYHLDVDVMLLEVQMELDIPASTTLHFVVYQQNEITGEWNSLTGSRQIAVIDPPGRAFYSSGPLNLPLDGGFDYIMAFAWGADIRIAYGRDILPLGVTYPGVTPDSFDIGLILGLVGTNITVPFPNTFQSIGISGVAAQSMLLCLQPVPGACCSPSRNACSLEFEEDCLAEAGAHFFGERTLCLDNVCDFGACCRRCVGKCRDNWTREACEATGGVTHWSGAACPVASGESLCPPVTGACCKSGGVCEELCEFDCLADGGTYRGDDTTCETNPCIGACCRANSGAGCIEITPTGCLGLSGDYLGDATTCATLPPSEECGGACCVFPAIGDIACGNFVKRSACTNDETSDKAFRGDGVSCFAAPGCQTLTTAFYGACCMPNGTCINMPDTATCEDDSGGIFNTGVLCDANNPVCVAAPCCLPEGSCERLTQIACEDRTGLWQSGTTTCSVAICVRGACCESDEGRCSIRTPTACTATNGSYSGNGTNCDEIATTCDIALGFGACCVNGSFCLDALTVNECGERNGVHSPDTTCAAIDDEPELEDCDQRGACCTQTGVCLFITKAVCNDPPILGTFLGIGKICTPDLCPSGACCNEDRCTVTGETFCRRIDGLNGSYKGDGTACSINRCVPSGACCINGNCLPDELEIDCDIAGGDYLGDDSTCDGGPCNLGTCCDHGQCTDNQIATTCETSDQDVAFVGGDFCFLDLCEPFGACCFTSGGCLDDKSESLCDLDGGTFSRDQLCVQTDCEPIGACCFRDGTCEDALAQSSCEFQGGTLSSQDLCADSDCEEIGACCLRDGNCEDDLTRADCEAQRGTSTPNRTCGQIQLCTPVGACCMPVEEGLRCFDDMLRDDCETQGGTYRGDETNCPADGSICGSCCSLTGCEDSVMSSECAPTDQQEVFRPGFTCEDRAGEPACEPRGACCPTQGECKISTKADCEFEFGSFAGDGTTCEQTADLCIVGACCDVFLDEVDKCALTTRINCEATTGAVFQGAGTSCSDQAVCTVGSCCPAAGFDDCFGNTVVSQCQVPTDFRPDQLTCLFCEGRGACCLDDDVACQVLLESECVGENVVYQGNGTTCPAPEDDDVCFVGACCDGSSDCLEKRRFDCDVDGGLYGGVGTTCDADLCPRLLSATPDSCTIDPAQPSAPNGTNVTGLMSVTLTYSAEVFGLSIDDFAIDTTPGLLDPPAIIGFAVIGTEITLDFDAPIPTREWTCITDLFFGGKVCMGFLPGDVNGNSLVTASSDVAALLVNLETPATQVHQCDIDRSGACSPLDIMREIDLLLGAQEYNVWVGRAIVPPCPAAP